MFFSLIQKAKKNPTAFGQLYEKFYDPIYAFIYFRTKDKQTTEDLVSATWEKALTNLQTLHSNHPTVFKVWLYKIARNTLFQHYREQPRKPLPFPENFEISPKENFVEELKNSETKKYLVQLIQGLPDIQREIVTMHFFGGLKNKEIAKILNESERAIAVYLSRALKTFKNRIKVVL